MFPDFKKDNVQKKTTILSHNLCVSISLLYVNIASNLLPKIKLNCFCLKEF